MAMGKTGRRVEIAGQTARRLEAWTFPTGAPQAFVGPGPFTPDPLTI
jgi:hypothetical protein